MFWYISFITLQFVWCLRLMHVGEKVNHPPVCQTSMPPFTFRWRYHFRISLSLADSLSSRYFCCNKQCRSNSVSCQVHHKTVQTRRSFYPYTKQLDTFSFSRSKVLPAGSHPWWLKSSGMWHCVVGWAVIRILKDHSVFFVMVKQFTSTLSGLLHSEHKGTMTYTHTQQCSVTSQKTWVLSLHFLVNCRTSWWGGVRSEAGFTHCVHTYTTLSYVYSLPSQSL